jgi:hypothetical protein
MSKVVSGTVEPGGVVLTAPLDVPDGTAVVVTVVAEPPPAGRLSVDEFLALPFFGMHRDVADGRDGVAVVNEARLRNSV